MEVERNPQCETSLCTFCSSQLPHDWPDGFCPIGRGRSLNGLLASSVTCSSCLGLNNLLRTFECELHDIGQGATIRFDVYLVPLDKVPSTLPSLATISNRPRDSLASGRISGGEGSRRPGESMPILSLGRLQSLRHHPNSSGLELLSPRGSRAEHISGGMSALYATEQDTIESVYLSMRSCLQKCLTTHRSCSEDVDPGWLPTRLIDVDEMKLTLSAEISEDENRRYIALSHQWGTTQFLTLTSQNLKSFRQEIPFDVLSDTFKHAIEVSRTIGVRYLWIDSLCIIQGSRDQSEWHREAASMAFVYRNALLTLAVSTGALTPGRRRRERQNLGSHCFRVGTSQMYYPASQVIVATDPEKTLSRRAWVMQEHLLAPRTIHFADPVMWECREITVKRIFSQLCIFPSDPTLKVWTAGLNRKDCLALWDQMVVKYSECLLSVASDKLVAISGLARIFAPVMKSKYVAGLWTQHLLKSLFWETARAETIPVGLYRAPSWSWASVEGGIKFQSMPQGVAPLASIEQASTTPVASDEFGEVRDGFIEVKGRLVILGTFDRRASRTLIYNDKFLRVSLDNFPSTDYGRLYLVPLLKLEAEQRYWSLLVCQKLSNIIPAVPEYQRLGVVTTNVKQGQESFSTNYTPWTSFYPFGQKTTYSFTTGHFEDPEVQKFRLV